MYNVYYGSYSLSPFVFRQGDHIAHAAVTDPFTIVAIIIIIIQGFGNFATSLRRFYVFHILKSFSLQNTNFSYDLTRPGQIFRYTRIAVKRLHERAHSIKMYTLSMKVEQRCKAYKLNYILTLYTAAQYTWQRY